MNTLEKYLNKQFKDNTIKENKQYTMELLSQFMELQNSTLDKLDEVAKKYIAKTGKTYITLEDPLRFYIEDEEDEENVTAILLWFADLDKTPELIGYYDDEDDATNNYIRGYIEPGIHENLRPTMDLIEAIEQEL